MNNDNATRIVGFAFLAIAIALTASGMEGRVPPVQARHSDLAPIIVVTATASLPTARPVESTTPPVPTATALPEPASVPVAPVVEVRYVHVEVPVIVEVTPVPLVEYREPVAVPVGATQVSLAPAGEQPIVSSIHVEGIDHPKPERFEGQPAQSREAPEAVTP